MSVPAVITLHYTAAMEPSGYVEITLSNIITHLFFPFLAPFFPLPPPNFFLPARIAAFFLANRLDSGI